MPRYIINFDDEGGAESDLAQIWMDAAPVDRNRITGAVKDIERVLGNDPSVGTLSALNGDNFTSRYLDWDLLRAFYCYDNKYVQIYGFELSIKIPKQ